MEDTAIRLIMILLFAGIVLVGSVWLQIFLSKKENKWLGLVIPFICFMFSVITVLSLSMYYVTEAIEVNVASSETIVVQSEKPSMMSMFATALPVFLLTNIPTLVFLAIYFACREKLKKRTELDKMNIQDL